MFSIQELRHVAITCPSCGTQSILDMSRVGKHRTSFTPRSCSACKLDYDTALIALDELQRAYAALSKLDGVVSFRAEVEP